MRRGYRAGRSFLYDVYLSFVSIEVLWKEKGTWVEENGPLSRSIGGWKDRRKASLSIFTPVSTVSLAVS